jgi:nucleotide-binding universal stress UspA family protein
MNRILLATDGSADSRAAVQMLEGWHLAGRAHVTVLTVVSPISFLSPALIGPASAGWAAVPEIVERETKTAALLVEEAAGLLRERGAEVETLVRHGAVTQEILQTLADGSFDLVVLGSHGRSRLAQILIGSVSHNVAKHAPCSVLVVRDTGPRRGRLLLAIDGSPQSDRAVQCLERLPLPPGQACTVLHVLQPVMESGDVRIPQRLAAAERLVETAAATLARAGYEADPLVHDGHPAQQILHVARSRSVDLLVVGARGLSGIQEFLLGSVSGRVLQYAPCSVLIAR